MDELKLDAWRKKFNDEADKFLLSASTPNDEGSSRPYELLMDESDEFVIKMNDELPADVKEKLQQILVATKPEDSV